MTLSRDLAARHAWQGAFAAAFLNAVGMPVDFLLARDIPTMPMYPYAMSVLVGIGLIVFLLIRRQRATVRLGSAVFLVNTVAILVALWITSGYWATTGRAWTPFQANKLGALAVAMLAPQLGVGLASIAGFAAMAIGKFYFLDPDIQRGFPVGEPWFVLIYALFGARAPHLPSARHGTRAGNAARAGRGSGRRATGADLPAPARLHQHAHPDHCLHDRVATGEKSRPEAHSRPSRTRGGQIDRAQPRSHRLRERAQMEPGRGITGGDDDWTNSCSAASPGAIRQRFRRKRLSVGLTTGWRHHARSCDCDKRQVPLERTLDASK